MKDVKQIATRLASEFVIESLGAPEFEIIPMPEFDEDPNVASMQHRYKEYCLKGKSIFGIGLADSSSLEGVMSLGVLSHIESYLANSSKRTNKAMKYLYEYQDISILSQQISMLSQHFLYQTVTDINEVPKEIQRVSLNPDEVVTPIAIYSFFTIVANDKIKENQFNSLFVNSWFNYFANWMVRQIMFRMRGNSWKEDFQGVLLDDKCLRNFKRMR